MQRTQWIPILALAVGSWGCSDNTGNCQAVVEPGLILEIRDSVTGLGLAAAAVATASEGTFSDTLRYIGDPDSAVRQGVDERAGTYTVTVTRPNYQTWTRTNVLVTETACHVQPVQIDVLLQPM